MSDSLSLALLEVSNLAPSFIVADACSKMANIHIIGIESTDGAAQCLKLIGSVADVRAAAEHGIELARHMGSSAMYSVMAAPLEETRKLANSKPASANRWPSWRATGCCVKSPSAEGDEGALTRPP